MTTKTETFESMLLSLENRYDLHTLFDDFLTLALCSLSPNPVTGRPNDEDIYLQVIEKYKNDNLAHYFSRLLLRLFVEVEGRSSDSQGNDVLGEFYEQNLHKGPSPYFTPWPACLFITSLLFADRSENESSTLGFLDPTCGSGRLLTAGAMVHGRQHSFYGIDIDHTCVKMAAMNLLLNGVSHGEIMWADALKPEDFRVSYQLSHYPFGIHRITHKEDSRLWYLYMSGFVPGEDLGKKKQGSGK